MCIKQRFESAKLTKVFSYSIAVLSKHLIDTFVKSVVEFHTDLYLKDPATPKKINRTRNPGIKIVCVCYKRTTDVTYIVNMRY